MAKTIDVSPAALRSEATELGLIAFSENSGWLDHASNVIAAAAARIAELEGEPCSQST